jgi:peptidoglycan/LPS O-acetylase OafA/YrhL
MRTRMQIQRFWLLDNLRGLASLSVVLFHYKHFFYSAPGVLSPSFIKSQQPFYSILSPFYDFGYNAVQLFFTLSGFVFFYVYYRSLRDGSVGVREFIIARFSRLYPLHILTLVLVAYGQSISKSSTGQFFVYPFNDAYHFLLNVLFVSDWGLQAGESFNGPIWSVSIEILLYIIFFLYAKLLPVRPSQYLALAIAAWLVMLFAWRLASTEVAIFIHSAMCFFSGGIVFFAWESSVAWKRSSLRNLSVVLAVGGMIGIACTVAGYRSALDFIVFPALVLSIAIAQSAFVHAGRRTSIIGDISYSTYLLHFPLQLLIVLIVWHMQATIDFYRPDIFLFFLSALLLISALTYHYFERPSQNYIRILLKGRKKRL